MTILLIEDSKLLRIANARALANADCQVSGVADGEEGLRSARETIPDLILLDMLLPKSSGLNGLKTKAVLSAFCCSAPVVTFARSNQSCQFDPSFASARRMLTAAAAFWFSAACASPRSCQGVDDQGDQRWAARASLAAARHKGMRILEGIAFDMPRDDASGGQGLTVASLHDTDFSRRNNHSLRDRHREQERIDPIGAGRDELHLRPALSIIFKEGARILEGVTIHLASDDASTRQRLAVASLHAAHLSRRHGEEFNTVHRVLPRPESDMEARWQGIRLIAGLTVQGDDPSVRPGPA